MPSQSHRDGLPSYYYRAHALRKIAAAIIQRARQNGAATPTRPSTRATAVVERREPPATSGYTTTATPTPRSERRALPASPEHPHIEIEASAPDLEWEWVYRSPKD